MLLSKKLDKDVRNYCVEINREVAKMKSGKENGKISYRAYPAMAVSCCFKYTPIYHDQSKSTANVDFDRRIESRFEALGGKKGEVVDGCKNVLGRCAEQRAGNLLLQETKEVTATYALNRIIFSRAYRPRTMQTHPMCYNCERIFS